MIVATSMVAITECVSFYMDICKTPFFLHTYMHPGGVYAEYVGICPRNVPCSNYRNCNLHCTEVCARFI